jgi:hypothetical protein
LLLQNESLYGLFKGAISSAEAVQFEILPLYIWENIMSSVKWGTKKDYGRSYKSTLQAIPVKYKADTLQLSLMSGKQSLRSLSSACIAADKTKIADTENRERECESKTRQKEKKGKERKRREGRKEFKREIEAKVTTSVRRQRARGKKYFRNKVQPVMTEDRPNYKPLHVGLNDKSVSARPPFVSIMHRSCLLGNSSVFGASADSCFQDVFTVSGCTRTDECKRTNDRELDGTNNSALQYKRKTYSYFEFEDHRA